jgi:hypothetical protein
MKLKKDYFIIPNEVFYGEEDERLNKEELYLFSYLLFKRYYKKNIYANKFKVIAKDVVFDTNVNRNRKKIEKHLLQLHEKGYIEIQDIDSVQIKKDNLEIHFPKIKPKPPFTQIPNYLVQTVKNSKEFTILVYILANAFKDSGNPEISITEFNTRIYGINEKPIARETIRTTLDEMEKQGFIYIERGKFFRNKEGEVKQRENKYKVNMDKIMEMEEQVKEVMEVATSGSEAKTKTKNNIIPFEKPIKPDKEPEARKEETEDERLKREARKLVYEDFRTYQITKEEYFAVNLSENEYAIPFFNEKWEKSFEGGYRIPFHWDKELEGKKRDIERRKTLPPHEKTLKEVNAMFKEIEENPFLLIKYENELYSLIDDLDDGEEKEKAFQTYEMLVRNKVEPVKKFPKS